MTLREVDAHNTTRPNTINVYLIILLNMLKTISKIGVLNVKTVINFYDFMSPVILKRLIICKYFIHHVNPFLLAFAIPMRIPIEKKKL